LYNVHHQTASIMPHGRHCILSEIKYHDEIPMMSSSLRTKKIYAGYKKNRITGSLFKYYMALCRTQYETRTVRPMLQYNNIYKRILENRAWRSRSPTTRVSSIVISTVANLSILNISENIT